MHQIAVPITDDLDLDVAGSVQPLLEEDRIVAKC